MMHFLTCCLSLLLFVIISDDSNLCLRASEQDPIHDEIQLADRHAAAEEVVGEALFERSVRKRTQYDQLETAKYSNWRESLEVHSECDRDQARLSAIKQFRQWLRELQEAIDAAPGNSTDPDWSVAHLELLLPGRQGALGWLRPERLRLIDREELFELLLQRSNLVATSTHDIDLEKCQMDFLAERRERLRKSKNISEWEMALVTMDCKIAEARYALAQTVGDRRRQEHNALIAAIYAVRNDDQRDDPSLRIDDRISSDINPVDWKFLEVHSLQRPIARKSMDDEPQVDLLLLCRTDRPLARKGISLVREWFEARSDRDTAQFVSKWRVDFVDRIEQRTKPNRIELVVARKNVESSIDGAAMASARMVIIQQSLDQIAKTVQDARPCDLSLVGDTDANELLASIEKRRHFNDAPYEQRVSETEALVSGLRQLRGLGHASVDELKRAELSLGLEICSRRSADYQSKIADLDLQIMRRALELR